MKIFWTSLKPFRNWLFLATGLAAVAQILELIDPIIFAKIIDNFAVNTNGRSQEEFIKGLLRLPVRAIGIALLAGVSHAFTFDCTPAFHNNACRPDICSGKGKNHRGGKS